MRSNSCLNSEIKSVVASNRRELLNQRRQRNLTTTALLYATSHDQHSNQIKSNNAKKTLNNEICFEDFLQSLEDINTLLEQNTYLDNNKKNIDSFHNNRPKQPSLPPQSTLQQPLIDQRQHYKRTRRNLTQPIVFNNELSRLCSTEK